MKTISHGSRDLADQHSLDQSLAIGGLRSTRQRRHVYDVLLKKRDHPTAEEIFLRAKERMPDISFATVYNCLDTLERCGLVRQVNRDRSSSRYCPNMREHSHFHCDGCDRVVDIEGPPNGGGASLRLPKGFQISHYEVSIRGLCPACAEKGRENGGPRLRNSSRSRHGESGIESRN